MSQHAAETATQRVLRRTARTNIGRLQTQAAVDAFFARYNLHGPAREAIAAKASKVHRLKRGDECFRLDERRIYLLVSGRVREEQHWGPSRIWPDGTLFGNWSGLQHHESRGTVLSDQARGLFLGVEDVRQIGGAFPELLLALAGATHRRLEATETVYGASRQASMYRVAALLLYLASARTEYLSHQKITNVSEPVPGLQPRDNVEGPTQADIADALGLSRAAVENAIAALRRRRALSTARRVRLYEIDRDALRDVMLETL
ncbi:helix-turn-helix domain-containing protein [Streptomyces violarus]|uniref:helix-turn-helix domain-containing protein n=1 Tax=Streptomyces violarus TaxID=67380 RepID=UPI0021BE4A34|nr:helix-turn-helix domain-containing protein [Streptomyces violarus]MCT9141794.1 helix-turn-helix domain-containing protein [Streptomyces violarus]